MGNQPSQLLSEPARGLQKIRDQLLAASQKAGSQGDFTLAPKVMELAAKAHALSEEIEAIVRGNRMVESPSDKQKMPVEPDADQGDESDSRFPQFRVRRGMLIKRGLQRDGRGVYEHSVPQDQFQGIITRLADIADKQDPDDPREFSVEDIDPEVPCPKYMIYVVLSLLQKERILQRPRKGAYLFAAPEEFQTAATDLWSRLQKTGPAHG
jgi:hypothetical protein